MEFVDIEADLPAAAVPRIMSQSHQVGRLTYKCPVLILIGVSFLSAIRIFGSNTYSLLGALCLLISVLLGTKILFKNS